MKIRQRIVVSLSKVGKIEKKQNFLSYLPQASGKKFFFKM
jgi:hypothetical protein